MLRKKEVRQEGSKRGKHCPLFLIGSVYQIHSLSVCKGYFFSCDLVSSGVCCLGNLRLFPRVLYSFVLFLVTEENEYPVVHATSKYLIVTVR